MVDKIDNSLHVTPLISGKRLFNLLNVHKYLKKNAGK